MTDAEIIKALECVSSENDVLCKNCSYNKHHQLKCQRTAATDAIDLINRQKAEIEKLKEENNIYTQVNHLIASQRDQRDKEIEELTNNIDNGVIACDSCHKKYAQEINNAKSEAIREFAERLKHKSELMALSVYAEPKRAVFIDDINNLAKEMECGDND